jgi:hypothetical protein
LELKTRALPELPGLGTIVLPVVFNQLHRAQAPDRIVALLDHMARYLVELLNPTVDVVFLYTDGLYSGLDGVGARRNVLNGLASHRSGLARRIEAKPDWKPEAFHFLAWNQGLVGSDRVREHFVYLEKLSRRHAEFSAAIACDLQTLGLPVMDPAPVLELLAVQSLIRSLELSLPKSLSNENFWNLLVYQTARMTSEDWVLKNKVFDVDPRNLFGPYLYLSQSDQLVSVS